MIFDRLKAFETSLYSLEELNRENSVNATLPILLEELKNSKEFLKFHPQLQKLVNELPQKTCYERFTHLMIALERHFDRAQKDYDFFVSTQDDESSVEPNPMPLAFTLVNLRSAFNVGSFYRLCDTAGVPQIILNGYTPGPHHPSVSRAALGAERYVNTLELRSIEDLKEFNTNHNLKTVAVETYHDSISLFEFPFKDLFKTKHKLNFIFGHERFGLDLKLIENCDYRMSVPTYGRKNSLNVVSAATAIAFEARRNFIAHESQDQ